MNSTLLNPLHKRKVDRLLALSISAPFSSYFRCIPPSLPLTHSTSAGKGVDNIVVEANDFNPNL